MKFKTHRHGTLDISSAIGGLAVLGLTYLALRSLPELIRYVRMSRM
jgi:hypothetical protein